ncbi:predicted protein [Plenodomus lingam JN3]|uniref:Predicted protein n=1 Tax=Leptosphaeria maculans (strain JN3 / isolate v23.1.3 / race Av1-4-5-6-7-8) TaxID=985895 RepID=E4ZN39_LEPMJ|nr:predicted protein [Plenodomus lingam JN3]CBX92642.1 predicted protein [Plenodomus lingam JN3]
MWGERNGAELGILLSPKAEVEEGTGFIAWSIEFSSG